MLDKSHTDENLILNELNDFLNNRILYSMCSYELKIYQGRIDRTTTKEQRYFNSTPIRNAFASLMIIAACNNMPFTITEIVNHLGLIDNQFQQWLMNAKKKVGLMFLKKEINYNVLLHKL